MAHLLQRQWFPYLKEIHLAFEGVYCPCRLLAYIFHQPGGRETVEKERHLLAIARVGYLLEEGYSSSPEGLSDFLSQYSNMFANARRWPIWRCRSHETERSFLCEAQFCRRMRPLTIPLCSLSM